jgi:hypothetical protein
MRLLAFFIIYFVALSYPAMQLFNRVEPFILGFPLSMAWVVLWVLLGWITLIVRYRADRAGER